MSKSIISKSLNWSRNQFEGGIEFTALITHLDFEDSSEGLTMSYSIYEPADEKGVFVLSLEINFERFPIGEYEDFVIADCEATRHYEMFMMSMSSTSNLDSQNKLA